MHVAVAVMVVVVAVKQFHRDSKVVCGWCQGLLKHDGRAGTPVREGGTEERADGKAEGRTRGECKEGRAEREGQRGERREGRADGNTGNSCWCQR